MKRWNKRKFISNVKELMLGTAYLTIPVIAIIFYGLCCKILEL